MSVTEHLKRPASPDPSQQQWFGAIMRHFSLTGGGPSASTPALATSEDDLDAQGATVLRAVADAGGTTITGVAGGRNGRVLRIANVGTGTLSLAHQDAGSAAENRIITPTGSAYNVVANGMVSIVYDGVDERWRVAAT